MVAAFAPVARWLGPPQLPTSHATRRAIALWKLSWSFFGLLSVLLITAGLATPALLTRRMTSIALVGVLITCLHLMNRSGRTVLASWLLIIGLVAIITERAWHLGGVHAPVALYYMMFVLMAAGLLGIQGIVIAALACLLSATMLAGAEIAGLLVMPMVRWSTPTEPFILIVLAIAVTVLCLTLLLRSAKQVATEDVVNMFVHDMRSPLTVVMARLSMLRMDIADDSEAAEHADSAMMETARLNRMANNLLDVSRLSSTSFPFHRASADVAALARGVAQGLGALAPSCQIEVRASEPVMCDCDQELVRRLIENLFSNAIKHTGGDCRIIVDVSRTVDSVRIVVEDDGPGIPASEREQIFERFSAKGMRTRTGHHSVGLGLAFCKLATAAHGGRIWVEDALPHGSRFIVELPAS